MQAYQEFPDSRQRYLGVLDLAEDVLGKSGVVELGADFHAA